MRKPRGVQLERRSNSSSSPASYGAGASVLAGFGARLLGWIYIASAIGGISQAAAFQCPPDHYQYPRGACSSCFTIVNEIRNFDNARVYCSVLGGELTTTENETNFKLLSRYLGGLNESRRLWIGYRYTSSGSKIGLEGSDAPSVVLDDNNFNGSTSGNDDSCIGIQNGKFIVAPCTNELPFICTIVYTAPSAVQQPNVNTVYAAQSQSNIQLRADVMGNGIKFVQWKFNGMGIGQGENGITVSNSNEVSTGMIATLTISSYNSASHLGTYEILATNQAGTAVVASWLLRDAVIDLTVMPTNLSIPEGQMAAFECYGAESKPLPTVTWYKDSIQINNGADPRVFISELSGTLFIREVQNLDASLYHCVVTNVAGTLTSRNASLTVLPSNATFDPKFILEPRDVTVLRGELYSVECSAAQNYQPSLIVTIRDINDGSALSYTYPENEGFPVYRVEAATLEEPGCYYCVTRSQPYNVSLIFGSRKSLVTVHAAAQIERLSTIRNGMRTEDNIQSFPPDDSAVLECGFSGIPTPSPVSWTRDGVGITNGIVPGNNTLNLSIPSLSESAVYQCHVENMYGKDSQTVFLCAVEQEDGVPGPVTFTAEPDTNTSIYVNWSLVMPPRTHPLLLRYEILLQDAMSNLSLTFGPFLSSQMSYTITGLEPNMEYMVSMVATSLQGRSNVTSQSVTTFPNPPTEMVSNITVQRDPDNTALIIEWAPYLTPEGREVTTAVYDIQYRVFGSDSSASRKVNGTLEVIRDLSNATNYEVRVRVTLQIVREPPQFVSSEWSEYIPVHGITTLPPLPTSPPQTEGIAPVERGGLTTTGLLLLIIIPVIVVILIIVVVISAIVIVWLRKPGGKYSIQDGKRRKHKGPQTPMRDEIFNISTSLPTSPSTSPPPLSISNQLGGGSRYSSSILGSRSSERERSSGTASATGTGLGGALIRNQENGGMCGVRNGGSSDGSLPVNVSNQSLRRSGSISPQPLPPPIAEVDSPYTSIHTNLYTMEPFTNHDPHIIISPPPSSMSVSFTDQVHDIPTHHFHKLDISDEMPFEGGSPEVFDRLEGFAEEPVHTVATFDILNTGGTEAGSCDTLTRDGIDSRNDIDSPATMSSLVNQTPEPQADHRVTFAPAVITISPVPHIDQEVSNAIMELNSSNCNNSQRFFASGGVPDIFNHQLPPVAEIVEGNELCDNLQLEPSSTITL